MVVTKSKLKARMLEYFREVERTGEPLVVTDHGRFGESGCIPTLRNGIDGDLM